MSKLVDNSASVEWYDSGVIRSLILPVSDLKIVAVSMQSENSMLIAIFT